MKPTLAAIVPTMTAAPAAYAQEMTVTKADSLEGQIGAAETFSGTA